MNVIKLAASTIGAVCVPIWFIDQIGSIGFVEGTSMEPTLKDKDIIWQQKWFFNPQEGQVFTFISPRDSKRVYIKRLAKKPGRQVRWKDGTPFVVPPNHYWMLADNPQNADDSRHFGAVNRGLLLSKATRIVWPPSRWRKL